MASKAKHSVQLVENQDDPGCFFRAKQLVLGFGHILSLYSSAIRAITAAPSVLKTDDLNTINLFAQASVRSPVSISPTITQCFQLAAQELYPKAYKDLSAYQARPKIKEVINLMTASELSAVLAITYFYKLMSKSLDSAELNKISPLISSYIKNGAIIGTQLGTAFGRGGGIAAAGLKMLGLIALMKVDLKAFKNLRRLIDDSGVLDHFEFERQNFGFTHLDIASVLAGELGFGTVARESLILYQMPKSQPSNPQAVFWRHTLNEATNLWQSKSVANKSNKKNAIGEFDAAQGYKWLWNQSVSQDILPGLDNSDLEMLHSSSSASNEPKISEHSSLRILIVEDDATCSSLLKKIVAPLGEIHCCASAELAIQKISESNSEAFDLVFLDISLDGISGLDFLNLFREQEAKNEISEELSALVFILTADENPQTVVKSFAHGANGYITKPLDKTIIYEELNKFGLTLPD